MALGLFRFIASIGKNQVVTSTLGTFTLLLVFVLGSFIISKNDLQPWMKCAYYISPMSYGQNAIAINEFLADRWNNPVDPQGKMHTVGKVLLHERGFYTEDKWFWISIATLMGFSILFNLLFTAALTFLNSLTNSKSVLEDEHDSEKNNAAGDNGVKETTVGGSSDRTTQKGMVLPFQPLSLVFDSMNYYVDMPAVGDESSRY